MSKSILDDYESLEVSGMPWQPPGRSQTIGSANLTSKILCARHNNTLHRLDDVGGHFVKVLKAGLAHAGVRTLSRKSSYHLINGPGVELWAMKLLLGALNAKVAATEGRPMLGIEALNPGIIDDAFYGAGLRGPAGLYVSGFPIGTYLDDSLNFAPLTAEDGSGLKGVAIATRGLVLTFLFDPSGIDHLGLSRRSIYRPWAIDLAGPDRTSRLIFGWRTAAAAGQVVEVELDARRRKGGVS